MEIRHLNMIQAVAEEGTLSKAGQKLHLTQSALSHQLKEAEQELGTTLFHRMNKRLVISAAGKIMLDSAQKINKELSSAIKEIKKQINENHGEIKLSTECYTCYHWLPKVLTEFQRDFENVEVNIFPEFTKDPLVSLSEGKTNMVITSNPVEDNNLTYKELFRDEQLAIVPKTHPWVNRKYVTAKDFENENLLIYRKPLENSHIYSRLLVHKNIKPKKVVEIQLTEAVIEMIKNGFGIKVMANWAIKPYLKDDTLRAIPITKNGLYRTWYLAHNKNYPWTNYSEKFYHHLTLSMRT